MEQKQLTHIITTSNKAQTVESPTADPESTEPHPCLLGGGGVLGTWEDDVRGAEHPDQQIQQLALLYCLSTGQVHVLATNMLWLSICYAYKVHTGSWIQMGGTQFHCLWKTAIIREFERRTGGVGGWGEKETEAQWKGTNNTREKRQAFHLLMHTTVHLSC